MEKHTAGKELEDVIAIDISLTSQSILLGFDFVALCQHKEMAAHVTMGKKKMIVNKKHMSILYETSYTHKFR